MQPAAEEKCRPTEAAAGEKSITASASSAATENSSGNAKSTKRKAAKPAENDDTNANAGTSQEKNGNGNQKRRRRVFSCQSCQRLKCRCEYDPGAQACHRCVTLRIECSLTGEILDAPSHPKPVDKGSIEERLGRHEKSLAEIKGMIEFVSRQFGLAGDLSKVKSATATDHDVDTPDSNDGDDGPENLADPVDVGIKSAPTMVLREIGEHVTQGYRRLEHVKLDLIQLQLLDEHVANELIRLFIKHHSHLLLMYDQMESLPSDLKSISPFLHSVCCLCALLYRDDLCGTPLHRQIYEQVRITLGQTLLSSPLNLEEINAVLVMSDHADGPEYIDSWLLTGYCVKQAMLSISFSKIVSSIKRSTASLQDRQAIHLWSTICLHHLHWSATTGRPSVLHTPYINQCNILLSFYQASMQDGMLVAEILLYSILHQKLTRRSYLDSGGECEEFKTWKQKWNHLMALSTGSMLRIGYYVAYLILAVRALEESGDAMSSKTFLSNLSFDSPAAGSQGAPSPSTARNSTQMLQLHTSRYAHQVLETFVEMPSFLIDSIPTYLCLCIGYSAIILAHYDETQSKVSAEVSLGLISRYEDWCMRTPSKSWAIKFAKLARQRLESRTGSRPPSEQSKADPDRTQLPGWSSTGMSTLPSFPVANAGSPSLPETRRYDADYVPVPEAYPMPGDSMHLGYENAHHGMPSMEDFFGGGFLDFMRQPRS